MVKLVEGRKEMVANQRNLRTILREIEIERHYGQDRKWGGAKHDDEHTDRDWVFYITKHLGKAVTWPFNAGVFRKQMIRVAALAVAAIQALDRASGRVKS